MIPNWCLLDMPINGIVSVSFGHDTSSATNLRMTWEVGALIKQRSLQTVRTGGQ